MPDGLTPEEYTEIAHSPGFRALLASKLRFLLPASIFFFVFYFALPLMTAYTPILNQPVIGKITGAWLFAFAQFVMIWAMCGLYVYKAAQFDKAILEMPKGGK